MFLRTSICVVLFVALSATSVEAQSFRQLGTRRGAITGAVIGGLIGGQNDEVAAGIIAGGLIGGVAGRAVGNRMDQRSAYQYGSYGYQQPRQYSYQPQTFHPGHQHSFHQPVARPYVQQNFGGHQHYSQPVVQPNYGYQPYVPQQQYYRGW
ncbi:MAG: glycine zipper domain-containing protein [Mariniblastus sp.]